VTSAGVTETDRRPIGVEVVQGGAGGLEQQRPPGVQPGDDEILHQLVLAVDGDLATGQLGQRDALPHSVEEQLETMVDHPLAEQPVGEVDLGEQLDGAVFEHSGPDAPLHVLAAV